MKKKKNIYKSTLDASLYFLLYIVAPAGQAVGYYIRRDNTSYFICIFLLLFSILYDCYTRYNSSLSKIDRCKIVVIGLAVFMMLAVSIILVMLIYCGIAISDWTCLLYLPFVVPTIICVSDGLNCTINLV